MRLPDHFATFGRLFALRNYRFYLGGIAASNVGVWVQRVAIGWLTWELTESTAWLGGIAIAEAAPMMVLGLIAGTVVDRMDHLRLLRITQAMSLVYSAVLAGLTLSGVMTIWLLLAITLLRGATMAFQRPSRMSLVFTLVGRDLLPTGLAVNSMVFNGSRFVGPALGGAIIVAAGIGWAFAAAWVLFLVFTLALRRLSVPPTPRRPSGTTFTAETLEGMRYIAGHPGIRMQMVVLISTAFFARPLIDLFPGFAAQVFAGGPETLASLMSALGFGAVGGGLFLAGRRGGTVGMTTVTLGAMGGAALALLAFTATGELWVALPLAAALGGALIVLGIGNQTLIQSAVAPALRGRVISLYGTAARATPSVGALAIGGIAETVGLRPPVAAGALLCLMVWAWAWRRRRDYAVNLEAPPPADEKPSAH
ncbi:MAG: MFS transporter [Rhodospirillales bacterium]|jgi:MFS family permease|nr:MFS transporter [Rhodospirillales bacterium]